MPSVEDRLELLEAALAALVPSEALTPNYLTIDPQGKIGANFSGHVTARGVDLAEAAFAGVPGPFQPQPTTALDWLDTAALVRQFLQGQRWNWNVGPTAHVQDELDVAVADTAGDLKATLTLLHHLSAGAAVDLAAITVRARNGAGTKDVTRSVLTSDGTSDYMQVVGGPAKKFIAYGGASISWPGGTGSSNTTVVSHGLGATPNSAVACLFTNIASFGLGTRVEIVAFSSTSLTLQAERNDVPGAGSTQQAGWVALL